jgi:hypothetical protein
MEAAPISAFIVALEFPVELPADRISTALCECIGFSLVFTGGK